MDLRQEKRRAVGTQLIANNEGSSFGNGGIWSDSSKNGQSLPCCTKGSYAPPSNVQPSLHQKLSNIIALAMRLLNAINFELKDFPHDQIPPYAILSHTWGAAEEEVIFQDMVDLERARRKPGFEKIQGCCQQARRDKFEWVWIDSCCIHKTSSAELSEAINTMFQWYKDSYICYAYLSDVFYSPASVWKRPLSDNFRHSRWFSRGWTLQELIAPQVVHFFNRDWENIATRASFASILEYITGVPDRVLRGGSISEYCVLEKMSWARNHKTTRIEDVAYSLLGLFEINMPLLYGEGNKAFVRLQEEILKSCGDYSLFAWEDDRPVVENIFASSPSQFQKVFEDSNNLRAIPAEQLSAPAPSIWGRVVSLEMQVGSDDEDGFAPAYLNCRLMNQLVCIMVARKIGHDRHTWIRRSGCTLIPLSSLSKFSPKQLCFKIMADSNQQNLYKGRYTSFVVSQLPPCMVLLPSRPNTQPIKKNIDGEEVFVFVHDTADRNDCTSIHVSHGPHENTYAVPKRLNFTNVAEDLLLKLNKYLATDCSSMERLGAVFRNTYEDPDEAEQLELTLSTFGLHSRAPLCDVKHIRNDVTVLQQSELSDQYSLLIEMKYAFYSRFLTVSIKPAPEEMFKVEINCHPVDVMTEMYILQDAIPMSLRTPLLDSKHYTTDNPV